MFGQNIAADQEQKSGAEWREQTRAWSDILRWEWEQVQPTHVFGLGGKVQDALRHLQREGLFPDVRVSAVMHYSARPSPQAIRDRMTRDIKLALGKERVADPAAPARRRRYRGRGEGL